MKYKAIIETNDYKDFEFFEDGIGKYMVGKDAGATASGGWIPLYFTKYEQGSVLDNIRVELIQSIQNGTIKIERGNEELFHIIDKYKAESEDKNASSN